MPYGTGTKERMSEAYIHHKHCKQRTGLVLGEVPFVAAARSSSLSHVLLARLATNPPSMPSHVVPAAHLGHCFTAVSDVSPIAVTAAYVTWMYIGSSCSWPVSWSTNPEPKPLICTRVPVSV